MNLLITTLGTSWQIVPELLSVTNPQQYDFFCGSEESVNLRRLYDIQPVDECWIITTNGTRDLEKLQNWAEHWEFRLRIFICDGVDSFGNEDEILRMRSLIYRIVLSGTEKADKLYLSLSGGRKTMSADMQEAGNLFGCDAMIHVVDKDFYKNKELSEKIRSDNLLSNPDAEYSKWFVPLIVNTKIAPSFVVAADKQRIRAADYPLEYQMSDNMVQHIVYKEDRSLEKIIQIRKNDSGQLFANFYSMISNGEDMTIGDIFRKLYFLHPDILRKIKSYRLGDNPDRDVRIISKLPKAELHSHIGGVLDASDIIEVAKSAADFTVDNSNPESVKFYNKIKEILTYSDRPNEFEYKIFGDYLDENNFYKIGIDAYQRLGDYQGSGILQTRQTIVRTLELYAEKLIEDNVRYVELRCSPYKYTRLGLSLEDVVKCMTETLDKYNDKLDYRLIYIIGREGKIKEIKESVEKITNLYENASKAAEKIVGIDLAGNESASAPDELRPYFMPLLERCMRITIHAGETEGADSIWQAVYHLSADRIGHGLRLIDKPELMHRFIDKNIGVEMCPSSNDQIIGYSKNGNNYPIKEYLNAGLKVTVNTDNCGISRTNLTNEFIKASQMCRGLTLWDVLVLIRNSLSIAFCDRETMNRLMHRYEDEILKICQEEFRI